MATYKTFPLQLKAIQSKIVDLKALSTENRDLYFDYAKMFVHPDLNNVIVLKTRTHGISGGLPFDEIDFFFVNEEGKNVEIKKTFTDTNAWYKFISELREIKIVNGKVELL
jgi:hypothetical protein